MMVRFKASLTVFDRCEGNVGNITNLSHCLQSPDGLCDKFLLAVKKTGAPLLWKDLVHKYWYVLLYIKSPEELA